MEFLFGFKSTDTQTSNFDEMEHSESSDEQAHLGKSEIMLSLSHIVQEKAKDRKNPIAGPVESLVCSDITFAILNEALNRIEPIVYGFSQEAKVLNAIVETISIRERAEVIKRGYIAKEMTIELMLETENKKEFLHKIKTHGKRGGIFAYENLSKIRYLQGRLRLQHELMTKAQDLITLSLDKFSHFIDNDLTHYN